MSEIYDGCGRIGAAIDKLAKATEKQAKATVIAACVTRANNEKEFDELVAQALAKFSYYRE